MTRHAAGALVLAACLGLAAALAGCTGPARGSGPAPIRGQARGLDDPTAGTVEVYRLQPRGAPERVPVRLVTPAPDGGFETELLPRGDYLVVLRLADRPPAFSRASVPGPRVALVPRQGPGPASIEFRAAMSSQSDTIARLYHADASGPITDRREVRLRGGAPVVVRGLSAGRWRLDIAATGATREIVLLGEPLPEHVVVAGPSRRPGAELTGRVTRAGSPVAGVAVTVRTLDAGVPDSRRWGRYTLTESDGGYRITDLPPGPASIRVESRDVPVRLLPPAVELEIPPSGAVARDFEIGL